jgi:hypothetical protein
MWRITEFGWMWAWRHHGRDLSTATDLTGRDTCRSSRRYRKTFEYDKESASIRGLGLLIESDVIGAKRDDEEATKNEEGTMVLRC